jgi:hypothetical protein
MKLDSRIIALCFVVAGPSLALAQNAGPTPQVQASMVTSGSSLALGQKIPMNTFKVEDDIVSIVLMTWSPATASAGRHFVEHRWLQDANIVSDNKHAVSFNTTPVTLASRRPGAAFGAGQFEVQTLLDGVVVGDEQFSITK